MVEVGDRGAAEQVGRVDNPDHRRPGGKLLDTHGEGPLGGQEAGQGEQQGPDQPGKGKQGGQGGWQLHGTQFDLSRPDCDNLGPIPALEQWDGLRWPAWASVFSPCCLA